MSDEFYRDKILLTSNETSSFSLLAMSAKLIIFNAMKLSMKLSLRARLVDAPVAGEKDDNVAFIKCCSSSLSQQCTVCSQWVASLTAAQRMRRPPARIRPLPSTRETLAFFSLLVSLSPVLDLAGFLLPIILALRLA